jgi:hypothetical protein
MSTPASAGAAPASAGVTSFLRKQELAPRQRGYGGQRAAKKAASRTAGGLMRPAFEQTTFIQENTLPQHSFVFSRETGQESNC